MTLPFGPPLAPMLAKLRDEIPIGDEWVYEPKWDGFRSIIFRDDDSVSIISRDGKPMDRYFPELPDALREVLPPQAIVDGEIVVAGKAGLDFDALLQRIHPAASRVQKLAVETPASFVAFDLLAVGRKDLRDEPLQARRGLLEERLARARLVREGALKKDVLAALRPGPRVALTPQTSEPDEAQRWFQVFEGAGLDGVIAKRKDQVYVPGERVMVKVKHLRTADCVVGGYRLSKAGDGIGSLLLGLYDDSRVLHYVGHTSSFKTKERRELLAELQPLVGGTSFGGGRTPGGPSRWSAGMDKSWVSLDPVLVCEVGFDYLQGDRFRHAATFLRWRPEKRPEECTFDQILLHR